MDAIELLEDDHRHLRQLMENLDRTQPTDAQGRAGIADRLEHDLTLHTRLEEEVFYPALREAFGGQHNALLAEALEEHRVVDQSALPDLLHAAPESPAFTGRAKALRELVEHHLDEEEKTLFPLAREQMGQAELAALGQVMANRRAGFYAERTASHANAGAGGLVDRAQELLRQVSDHPARSLGWGVEETVRASAEVAVEIMDGARRGWRRAKSRQAARQEERQSH